MKSVHRQWLDEKKIDILMQLSYQKHPELPHIPLAGDLAKTPEEKQMINLFAARQVMGRPFFAPPDMPKDRAEMLRKAFLDTLNDQGIPRRGRKAQARNHAGAGRARAGHRTRHFRHAARGGAEGGGIGEVMRVSAVVVAAALLAPSPSAAQTPAEFYKGKQVSIYVGFSAGGTYDLYARVLARHIGRHIPGNPSVVPRNMEGAGSLRLANYIYQVAPRDGTAIATIGRATVAAPLFGVAAAQFDPRRLSWLGSANDEVSICAAWHTLGHRALRRPQDQGICLRRHRPDRGSGADLQDHERAVRHQDPHRVGLSRRQPDQSRDRARRDPRPLRAVVVEREGDACSIGSTRRSFVPLLQVASAKHADLQDVPLLMELAQDEPRRGRSSASWWRGR